MGIKVGINGFGRIGRVVFRTCMENPDIEVTALNDPAINVEYITYLIKFDSTHGKFKGSVINNQTEVIVNGMTIKVFSEELPELIPWASADVRYVVEASGMFTSFDKASGHLCSESVRRVIVAAPCADVPMIVLGVNHKRMTSDLTVVSGASSTLYCLAPIVKVLEDNFGLSEGFVTSIHAMTPSLKPLDGLCMRGRHWRDHRSIHQNIIPSKTGACKALCKILPKTKDRLAGIAFRVPTVDVSALDITVRLSANTTLQSIIKCVEQASATYLKRIIKTSNEGAVSSDFIGDSCSCILDVESCIQLRPNFYKLICWYENEYSYANRIVNTIVLSAETSGRPMYPIKTNKILKPRKQGSPRCKGDEPPNTSKVSPRRGISPDLNSPRTKKTNVFNIWNNFSMARSSPTGPFRQNKPAFQHNLVPVATPPTAAKLSPEFLKKLNRDFATSPPNKPVVTVLDVTEPQLLQRPPETNDRSPEPNETKLKANKTIKERPRIAEPRRNLVLVPRNKCDNIQMAAVLRDIPHLGTKAGSTSDCIDNNVPSVSSDIVAESVTKSETSHKIAIVGKLQSHKNEVKLDQNIVTEIEAHPIRSLSPSTTHELNSRNPSCTSKTKENGSQSDILDNELAKTIDLFVDGVTHDNMLMDTKDYDDKTPKASSVQSKESAQFGNLENLLAKKIYGKAEPVRLEEFPKEESSKSVQCSKRELSKTVSTNSTKGSIQKTPASSTVCNESETGSVKDDGKSGKRSLIIDMQQEYDATETECESRSDHTLSEVELSEMPETLQALGSFTHTRSTVSKKRRDIYDKVDSTSLSDSENSFYVNERKSEVINITDLTRGPSLEDLEKLDKICRIMEISDELSDKLFSALPKAEAEAAGMKGKWSFKELCEKIKFDEFCEAVFDK